MDVLCARVQEVVDALRPFNLTLANYASINEQQIGGFTQAGAHGTGATLPPADAQVVRLRLATPARGTLELSALRPEDRDLFYMARQGLGALGVVVEVTLQCVPAHQLTERTVVLSRQEAVAGHAARLQQNRHLRYMWIPHTDAVVVVTCNPTQAGDQVTAVDTGAALEPLRALLLRVRPATSPAQLARYSFADLRDQILAAAPLDLDHVRACNLAEAEFWRRTQGVTNINSSDRVLGFECGGHQWVSEVCFPVGSLQAPNGNDMAFLLELLHLIEARGVPAPAPIEQRWTASSASAMSHAYAPADGPPRLYGWVGIIMYLCLEEAGARAQIAEAFRAYRQLVAGHLDQKYGAFVHWAKLELPLEPADLQQLQLQLRQRFPVQEFNRWRHELDPKGVLSTGFIDRLFGPVA
jgi:L-galactono-1,4-lactone dehydrogenase